MVKPPGRTFKARPRLVPPPGTTASASLPGYRRAGVGAGRVDPLPPPAPPRHALFGACKPAHLGILGHPTCLVFGPSAVGRRYAGRLRSVHSIAMTVPKGPTGVRLAARTT